MFFLRRMVQGMKFLSDSFLSLLELRVWQLFGRMHILSLSGRYDGNSKATKVECLTWNLHAYQNIRLLQYS